MKSVGDPTQEFAALLASSSQALRRASLGSEAPKDDEIEQMVAGVDAGASGERSGTGTSAVPSEDGDVAATASLPLGWVAHGDTNTGGSLLHSRTRASDCWHHCY